MKDKRVKVKGLTTRVNHFCDKACLMKFLGQPAQASQTTLGGFLLEGGTSEPPVAKNRATRQPDPLFEALAHLDGGCGLTKCAQRTVAVALAEIKRATPDVTPPMIQERARNLRVCFPQCHVTASSLAKHWARVAVPPPNSRVGLNHNHNIDKEMGDAWELQAQARIQSLTDAQAIL